MNKILFIMTHSAFGVLSVVLCILFSLSAQAQPTATWYESTEGHEWKTSKVKLTPPTDYQDTDSLPLFMLDGMEPGIEFRAWGTTFNELDWDALNRQKPSEQEQIMHNLFSPDGDLRFTRGRVSMNANDYARGWYSCDTVDGDFGLKYFNIERDKQTIIPLIRKAQQHQPQLTLWMSPWSPPAWMKINHDYPVLSNSHNTMSPDKDYLLYGATDAPVDPDEMKLIGDRNGVFPRRLATTDYMIQDPRYLQAYADMFCRFIELYAEQGVKIDMVMYQNEAYSYTPYPGCAWTAEGTTRFNIDYLAPTLQRRHPEVHLYLGTFNTNRQDYIERILSTPRLADCIEGIGSQWENRDIVQNIISLYPQFHYICSESECGNGAMDWAAAEHTFHLIADNTGKGIDEYYNWNFILTDRGTSPWGWNQNALIQVDSRTNHYRYTPEYYAYKHFSHFVGPQSLMVAYQPCTETDNTTTVIFRTLAREHIIISGNFSDVPRQLTIRINNKVLSETLKPHSFNTFVLHP